MLYPVIGVDVVFVGVFQLRLIERSPLTATAGERGVAGKVIAVISVVVESAVFTPFFGRTPNVYEVPAVRFLKVYDVAEDEIVPTT